MKVHGNHVFFQIFMYFSCFHIKSAKRTLPRAATRAISPNHCICKQNHRSRRGAIHPGITKNIKISIFRHFRTFSPKIIKFGEIWWISWSLLKRGCLRGPAPRSLFFLRNIKVSEPPGTGKLVRNGEFSEISWNLVKFHEISWFLQKFHYFCVFYIFLRSGAFRVVLGGLKTLIIL